MNDVGKLKNVCNRKFRFNNTVILAQEVNRRPLSTEGGFAPASVHVGFVLRKVPLG